MSREIKFRAWTGKTMFFPTQITFANCGWSVQKGFGVSIPAQPHIKLMQFTGLLDKQGKEIYEGDICIGIEREQGKKYGYTRKEQVYGHRGGFSLFSRAMQDYHTQDDMQTLKWAMWHSTGAMGNDFYYEIVDIEVIGNIYENPELLKEKITNAIS